MNRFKIISGKEETFEEIWKSRDTHLENVPGFKKFNLIFPQIVHIPSNSQLASNKSFSSLLRLAIKLSEKICVNSALQSRL